MRFPLGLFGREIPEGRVNALSIVVTLDVAEQIPASLFARRPAPLMDQLRFQGVEERLHRSVVIAATRPAH